MKKIKNLVKITSKDLSCEDDLFYVCIELWVLTRFPVYFTVPFRDKIELVRFDRVVKTTEITKSYSPSEDDQDVFYVSHQRFYFSVNGGSPIYHVRDITKVIDFYVPKEHIDLLRSYCSSRSLQYSV